MRKRNSFARIGILSVALLMALGAMGTAYGLWSKTLDITTTLETGMRSAEVTDCTCLAPVSCSFSGDTLEVTLTGAAAGTEYTCGFTLTNTGSIPVKIQSVGVVPSTPPPVISVRVEGLSPGSSLVGVQIEQSGKPGDTVDGIVYVTPDTDDNTTFWVTFEFVQWNLYVGP